MIPYMQVEEKETSPSLNNESTDYKLHHSKH